MKASDRNPQTPPFFFYLNSGRKRKLLQERREDMLIIMYVPVTESAFVILTRFLRDVRYVASVTFALS